MQSHFTEPGDVWARIPADHKRTIRDKHLGVYYADMVKIAREWPPRPTSMRMQGIVLLGAFLKLTPYAHDAEMSDEAVYGGVEEALRSYFGSRGEQVVLDNLTCA